MFFVLPVQVTHYLTAAVKIEKNLSTGKFSRERPQLGSSGNKEKAENC